MSFYTRENTRGEPFYKLPQLLFKDENLKKLSSDAKILYAIMQNRVTLSEENRWIDDDDRVFIYLTINETMELINCSNKTAIKVLKELECMGLIQIERQGVRSPNKIFVKSVNVMCNNYTSRSVKSTFQEVKKLHSSKNEYIKTDYSKNNSSSKYNNNYIDNKASYYPNQLTCIKEYIQKINSVASSLEIERLTSWLDEVEESLIIEAINEAVLSNVRNFKYINSILNRCLDRGIKTGEQFRADKNIRKGSEQNGASKQKPTADEFRKFIEGQR